VDLRTGLDDVEERKILHCRDSNSDRSVDQPVASRYTDTDCAIPAPIIICMYKSECMFVALLSGTFLGMYTINSLTPQPIPTKFVVLTNQNTTKRVGYKRILISASIGVFPLINVLLLILICMACC
jgi:hypothetical protein